MRHCLFSFLIILLASSSVQAEARRNGFFKNRVKADLGPYENVICGSWENYNFVDIEVENSSSEAKDAHITFFSNKGKTIAELSSNLAPSSIDSYSLNDLADIQVGDFGSACVSYPGNEGDVDAFMILDSSDLRADDEVYSFLDTPAEKSDTHCVDPFYQHVSFSNLGKGFAVLSLTTYIGAEVTTERLFLRPGKTVLIPTTGSGCYQWNITRGRRSNVFFGFGRLLGGPVFPSPAPLPPVVGPFIPVDEDPNP